VRAGALSTCVPHPARRCRRRRAETRGRAGVRKTPSWSRSWANFGPLQLHSYRNARANSHRFGQPNTFLARPADRTAIDLPAVQHGLAAAIAAAGKPTAIFLLHGGMVCRRPKNTLNGIFRRFLYVSR
jgi:hypothetical protein